MLLPVPQQDGHVCPMIRQHGSQGYANCEHVLFLHPIKD